MIDDDRGRVPFALVGVLLLVGSATVNVGVQPQRQPVEPAVDVVVDRVSAETRTALRAAAARAAERAAADPVLQPANTTAGRVLDANSPFRDALRLRIYHRTRTRLSQLGHQRDDVRATASLPPTPNANALGRAKQRVSVDPVPGTRTGLRVTVDNVTVTARRDGRVVGQSERSVTVVVRSPVLAVHERVSRFDDRLDRGLTKPGLARRVTGRLYAATWARGYAQYGGGLVDNVVANRHVELVTNGGLLAEQRAVFGRSDRRGRRAHRRATAEAALTDLLGAAGIDEHWLDVVFQGEAPDGRVSAEIPRFGDDDDVPGPTDEMTIGVDRTADEAFATVTHSSSLTETLQSVYSADARIVTEMDDSGGIRPRCRADRPVGWRLNDTATRTSVETIDTTNADVSVGGDWHVLDEFGRTVRKEVTRSCTWKRGMETRTTTVDSHRVVIVEVGIVGRHERSTDAPDREIATVHERGAGPLNGPNLADVETKAIDRLVDERGGRDGLAERAVSGTVNRSSVTIRGEVPEGLKSWVVDDLASLEPSIRNVSTTVRRGRVGTFESNPPGKLATTLDDRRTELLDAPAEYQSVAEKARVAARAALLDETIDRLRARRDSRQRRARNLGGVLGAAEAGSRELLEHSLDAHGGVTETDSPTSGTAVEIVAIEGDPPYLTTAAVGPGPAESLPSGETIHPLAARNVNVFTLPHGDVSAALLDGLGSPDTVAFRTAARSLHAVESAAQHSSGNETVDDALAKRSTELEALVSERIVNVRVRYLQRALERSGVGESQADRQRLVDRGLSRWDSTGARAVALTNGSAATAIARVGVEENQTKRVLVRSRLERALAAATDEAATRVPRSAVSETVELSRRVVRGKVEETVESAVAAGSERVADEVDDRLQRSLNRVPAGLPVSPVGPAWWATTNLWYVEVAGGYDRFAVRTRAGDAGAVDGSVTYVRDGSTSTLDYDGDGVHERLGSAPRVSFTVETAVVIVVPPGSQGVGDKDGVMVEESAGWSAWSTVDTESRGNSTTDPVPPEWPDREPD